jgi:hypothetical protein
MIDFSKFLSRKFLAMIIGIIAYILNSIIPELEIENIEGVLWLIVAYILAEGTKDVVVANKGVK